MRSELRWWLDGRGNPPVTLEMAAMAQELPDDAEVLKWVDKLKLSYPHVPGH